MEVYEQRRKAKFSANSKKVIKIIISANNFPKLSILTASCNSI